MAQMNLSAEIWSVDLWTWGGVGGIERGPLKHVPCHAWSWMASGNLLCDAGSSKRMFCNNLEGRDGLGGGRHSCTCARFMVMYGRNRRNVVQQLSSN